MSSGNQSSRAGLIVIPFLNVLEKEPKRNIEDYPENEIKAIARNVFSKALPRFANLIHPDRAYDLSAELAFIQGYQPKVESDIQYIWGRPLTMLEVLIEISDEARIELKRVLTPDILKDEHLLRALFLLHARGRQVSSEIFHLLNGGYAEGAYTRWRTLYEIAITARFIIDPQWISGREELAERYLYHQNIMKLKKARGYQEFCAEIGDEPIPEEEMEILEAEKNRLCKRFGSEYNKNYGWAEQILGNRFCERFDVLEKAIGYKHMRPYFALASTLIHAGAWGDAFHLGMSPGSDSPPDTERVILGSSVHGLTLPLHATSMYLEMLTSSMLSIMPTRQSNMITALMRVFSDEIKNACIEAEKHLESSKIVYLD
jgi:hypothetical protein